MRSARKTVLAVSAVFGAATVVVTLFPRMEIASHLPALRAGPEEAPPSIALIAVFVVLGRLARGVRLTELTLACSLGALALSELAFGVGLAPSGTDPLSMGGDLRVSSVPGHGTEVEAVP